MGEQKQRDATKMYTAVSGAEEKSALKCLGMVDAHSGTGLQGPLYL